MSIALLLAAGTHAQDPAGAEEIARDLIEHGRTEEAEELYATVTGQVDQPVNLNGCSREELAATGIFSPFQVFAILDQRERYGPFLSIYELAAIPGINREFLEEIQPMISFSAGALHGPSVHIDGNLLTNVSARLPRVSGMLLTGPEPAPYQGGLLKYTQRLQLNYGEKLSFGAAFEKDAGESWTNRKRPEHLAGYLSFTPGGHIKELVIGNFRIHRGMGLVHGLGFNSRGTSKPLTGYRRSYGKPFASTLEYDYFRGIYGQASAGKWEMDLFLSHQPADISFFRMEAKSGLFGMTRKTGLHRTLSERQGVHLARLSAAGASFNRSGKNLYAGCSFTAGQMRLTKMGMDSLQTRDPGKAQRSAISLYGVAFGSTFELYGEFAMDNSLHGAFLLGGTLVINPAISCDASVKRVAPGYRGVMPGPERDYEDAYNLRLGCSIAPFRYGRIRMYHALKTAAPGTSPADIAGPERYTTIEYSQSTGSGPEIRIIYIGTTVQEIVASNKPGNGMYKIKKQQHLRIHFRWEPSGKCILQGRIEISTIRNGEMGSSLFYTATSAKAGTDRTSEPGDPEAGSNRAWMSYGPGITPGKGIIHGTGSMAYQQVQLVPREGIRITYRYLIFDVPNWENRIYTYEPGVRYSFLFPAWYGKGSRNVLVVSAKVSRRITLRCKYGWTSYAHRWSSGTGNDLRKGNCLFDAALQLQADLF